MRFYLLACAGSFLLIAGCARQDPFAPTVPVTSINLAEPAHAFRVIHDFLGAPDDGSHPIARLTEFNGTLYGTTDAGGSYNRGTIFKIAADGTYLVLQSFGYMPGDAATPKAGLVPAGPYFYGATFGGGASGGGTVYSTQKGRTLDVIHNFARSDGWEPRADLIHYGELYGTTEYGGKHNLGTVFELSRSGTRYHVLHSFSGSDGARPEAGLTLVGRNLYGTTYTGGKHDFGTVFELDAVSGAYRVLHSFGGKPDDGRHPTCELVTLNGLFYGTTRSGGSDQDGTIFEVKPDGAERVVRDFAGLGGLYHPVAGLTVLNNILYGTTTGSRFSDGSVFAFDPATRNLHVMHRFHATDGGSPNASLIVANGSLYGTTYRGGSAHHGVVFEVTP